MPVLKRQDGELTLSLSGAPDFQAALAQVRSISGRRFDGDTKLWHFPDEPGVAERLMLTLKPTADAALVQWVRNSRVERDAELTTPLPNDAELVIPWADRLFNFQRAAVAFIAAHPHMILGDDMGLGKSVQALSGIIELLIRYVNDEQTYGQAAIHEGMVRAQQTQEEGLHEGVAFAQQGSHAAVPQNILRGSDARAEAEMEPEDDECLDTKAPWSNSRSERQALCGLRDMAASGSNALGSHSWQEALFNWSVAEREAATGGDSTSSDSRRTSEVRSQVPELSRSSSLLPAPILVVCPNSAKGVWRREAQKWLGDQFPVALIDAAVPKKRLQQLEAGIKARAICVVNYEQIRAKKIVTEEIVKHRDGSTSVRDRTEWVMRQPIFTDTRWLAIVADECHRAKNHKSQTARGLWKLQAPIQLALSGTPLMNHPAELWSVLRWLYPEQYHEQGKRYNGQAWAYWPFYDEYVDDYDSGFGRVIVGVKNPDALRFELKDRLVRRTKGQKLDLPPKVREIVPVTLNPKQRKAYEQAETAFWLEIEQAIKEGDAALARDVEQVVQGTKRIIELSNGAARTVRLRQVASTPALLGGEDDSAKLDAAVEIITDAAEDKQFVVFTEFVGTANILVERLRKSKITAEAFTGEVKDTRVRTDYEDKFQNGDIRVLVGTLAAMRESITLTAADTVIFVERAWVPAWNTQAEDRLWRTGQENKVTVLILEAEDTVDESRVKPTNAVKEAIVSAVIHQDQVKETTRGE